MSATLCPTKAFIEYLVETILAFVEALGHNVVMLHSDQEPVFWGSPFFRRKVTIFIGRETKTHFTYKNQRKKFAKVSSL